MRVLPENVANQIAAGEVVERPASVVKELVENAIDAGATRIGVRVVGDGRRLIEVVDNGFGMGEQDAILAVDRHATSKIRKSEDLDNIETLGFRGEALASIAAVSRFELVTRRPQDTAATRIQIDGGILRDVSETGAPPGTRVTVNRLYFNTPVRAKFLKGITTELSHCIDAVQRHALAHPRVGFQFTHNEKLLLDVPENATLRERVALIWGLQYVRDMVEINGEHGGYRVHGLIGTPALTRSGRTHQFFFVNGRPVRNSTLQYGFEAGYQGLVTIGRHPVGVVLLEGHPRFVDVNIHPTKREVRFRDDRVVRDALRDLVRERLAALYEQRPPAPAPRTPYAPDTRADVAPDNVVPWPVARRAERDLAVPDVNGVSAPPPTEDADDVAAVDVNLDDISPDEVIEVRRPVGGETPALDAPGAEQTEFDGLPSVEPDAVFRPMDRWGVAEPLQLFETYLLVPEADRLLIIDQHALHERLNYDALFKDLRDSSYAAQQLAVPLVLDVPPAHAKLLESNVDLFAKLGIEIEPFGGATFQVTGVCHLYDERKVPDAVFKILDALAQGDLFDREDFLADFLRLATEACRASVKAGDRLTPGEKAALIAGFRRLRPPYTCPHGRPIITELTLMQMEKSFKRRQ